MKSGVTASVTPPLSESGKVGRRQTYSWLHLSGVIPHSVGKCRSATKGAGSCQELSAKQTEG